MHHAGWSKRFTLSIFNFIIAMSDLNSVIDWSSVECLNATGVANVLKQVGHGCSCTLFDVFRSPLLLDLLIGI